MAVQHPLVEHPVGPLGTGATGAPLTGEELFSVGGDLLCKPLEGFLGGKALIYLPGDSLELAHH